MPAPCALLNLAPATWVLLSLSALAAQAGTCAMPRGADAHARASQPSASSSTSVASSAPEHAATASLMQ
eukprot:4556060-Heterocapsa_arctica.AAC.1